MSPAGDGRGAVGRRLRLAGLLVSAAALSGAAFAQSPAASPAPTTAQAPATARDYVEGFCLPLAGGWVDDTQVARFLREWESRPGSSAGAESARPVDASAPGQQVIFADKAAPIAFLESRRGVCTLIWRGSAVPPEAVSALTDGRPPVGPKGAPTPWLKIIPIYGKAPPPPKYLLRLGGSEDRGVCAERRDDLRLRDGAPVSLLQLAPCRLGPGETLPGG